jgi:hypothetical protein
MQGADQGEMILLTSGDLAEDWLLGADHIKWYGSYTLLPYGIIFVRTAL